jgi:beta-glucosidase
MDRIDEAVYRILLMKKRLGLFENPTTFSSDYGLVSSDSFSRVSNAVAEESITLLKNTGILPLNPSLKVLVTGPTANSLTAVNGAWSRTWQGIDEIWDDSTKHTILDELKLQSDNITFFQGCDFDSLHDLGGIKSLAKPVDVIVACFGEQPSTEKPGDIHSLDISETQIEYFKYLKSFNVPIVLALIENRPRVVRELEPYCDAIVLAYQPSENGTKAFGDILYGKVNPSGKLPLTYPRYTNTLVPYDHNHTDKLHTDFSYNAFNPQWEFGHGLSYTNFTYSNLSVDTTQLAAGKIGISIDVSNTGDYDGKETVLVYVTDEVASIAPPVKRLRAFDKRLIEVGKTETYQFEIDLDDLAFVGLDNTWQTESGTYTILIGNGKVSFNLN